MTEAPPAAPEARTEKAPAQIGAQAAPADLRVTAAFDRSEYLPGSLLPITVTVENVGGTTAEQVRINRGGNVGLNSGWELFNETYTLAPGEVRRFDLVGRQYDQNGTQAEFFFYVNHSRPDPTPEDTSAKATASVPQRRGAISGVLYTDVNANGRFDAGEQRAGAEFRIGGGAPSTHLAAVTGANGEFAFPDVPTGDYYFTLTDATIVVRPGHSTFSVRENATTDLAIPTARPVSDSLTARIELDRDTYGRGDPITVKITLTNTGTATLTNVIALCNQVGEDSTLGSGPGWAPLHPKGPGLTIAAGESKVLEIADVVPDAAYEAGSVHAYCNFGNNGIYDTGYVGASDQAKVLGARGSARGDLTYYPPSGAPQKLADVAVLLVDRSTKAVVARTRSDVNGAWTFPDVPVGDYDVLVIGPYKSRYNHGFVARVHAVNSPGLGCALVDGPMVQEPPQGPNLSVTASFDKASYELSDRPKVTVKVKNTGNATARYSRFEPQTSLSDLYYNRTQWGAFHDGGGATLQPGEEQVVTLTGTIRGEPESVRLKGRITTSGDLDESDNAIDLAAPVMPATGDAVAQVYGDLDGDGAYDDGEGLSDVQITIGGGRPYKLVTGRTDASGRFRLDDVPTGKYTVRVHDDKTGWVRQDDGELVVVADQETQAQYGMERPLSDELHASVVFDRDTYGPDDQVVATLTLSNSGSKKALFKAFCGGGEIPALMNDSGWGPFDSNGGAGVELEAGETRVFTYTVPLPNYAADYGVFDMSCTFGPDRNIRGLPETREFARVPGAVWTKSGRVITRPTPYEPVPVPNVTIVLTDYFSKKPVARTVAGPDGSFTFSNVPVGFYTPVIVGPWKFNVNWGPAPSFRVIRGGATTGDIDVEPGPEVGDPGNWEEPPTGGGETGGGETGGGETGGGETGGTSGTSGTSGGSGAEEALAATGASVVGLGLIGLLVLAFGVGTRVVGRRRTV
ncbi:carboxypeptidase-like regulatory domain-containing protein [Actinosynnema sp. NPDC047251]|uniref:carboxypeptidase-like regulatory domain-containing protein n=1 Tax=Saccharothrix espanaensis TaxID=103731 RepID=UPI0011DDEE3E|nr:carboxypeptidase-like regulatory domain-containing protein [Saccharothrix espanaensis]